MDDDKAGMYVKPPSGSYVSWENTMCNPLGDMRTQTQSAWHDGYASAKVEREWQGLRGEQIYDIAKTLLPKTVGFIDVPEWVIPFARAIEAKLREKNFDRPS